MSEPTTTVLRRAKKAINAELEAHTYTLPTQKKAFINSVLDKTTIDSLDDADAVMDALDNEN